MHLICLLLNCMEEIQILVSSGQFSIFNSPTKSWRTRFLVLWPINSAHMTHMYIYSFYTLRASTVLHWEVKTKASGLRNCDPAALGGQESRNTTGSEGRKIFCPLACWEAWDRRWWVWVHSRRKVAAPLSGLSWCLVHSQVELTTLLFATQYPEQCPYAFATLLFLYVDLHSKLGGVWR